MGLLGKSLMRASRVVVVSTFLQHTNEVSVVQDEQLIKAFSTNRVYPPFRHGIGFQRSQGSTNDFKAFGDENLVEAGGELAIAVM